MMRVPSSGRRGTNLHAPTAVPTVLQSLAPPAPPKPVRQEMQEFCEALPGVSVDWSQFSDDDELRGLASLEMLAAAGCPADQGVRVLSKLRGLLERQQAWAAARRARLHALLLSMLRRDNDLRLSDETQQRYADCGDFGEAKERVTEAVQRQVAREAGFTGDSVAQGVDLLRSALSFFPAGTPGHEELVESCFYLKFNIHRPCPLRVGAPLPELRAVELLSPSDAARAAPQSLREVAAAAPLTVLCAGSATWPPFLHDAPQLRAAARSSARSGVQWCMLYICEAHASDTWPLKFSHEQPRPASLEQRQAYALRCAASLGFSSSGFRCLVDTMDDACNAALGAWPTAYFVVDDAGTLLYIGEAKEGEYGYDLRELTAFVRRWCRARRLVEREARSSPQGGRRGHALGA